MVGRRARLVLNRMGPGHVSRTHRRRKLNATLGVIGLSRRLHQNVTRPPGILRAPLDRVRVMLLSRHHVEPRILLIEDAPEALELARIVLESQGCHVAAVSSAEAALGLMGAGERFDLVLSDIQLGGLSGIDVAQRLRACQPQLPVLLTSGLARDAIRRELGDDVSFLPKPYSMTDLLDAVRTCLERGSLAHLGQVGAPPASVAAA